MRLVVFIFAIYITGIMSFPCTDEFDHHDCDGTEVTDTHEDDDCEDEQCSPFCTCQCCHTNITWINSSLEETNHIFESIPSDLNTIYKRQIVVAIWDPPRSV